MNGSHFQIVFNAKLKSSWWQKKKKIERWKLKLLGRVYFGATFFYKTLETLRRKCEVLSATLMENLGPSNVHVLFILEIKNINSLAPNYFRVTMCVD